MNVTFTAEAWEQFLYWQGQDQKLAQRIVALIKECQRHPFEGTGKPEPLRASLAGYWSRRIDREHRLVYRVTPDALQIIQCRFHY
ncbi:Txe/YoeB family addiction module toxin [Anianabacter salinae]|uniref:Txe/YoeB family addiction module toxin n=1 Tax=Anianabacter salinae TaxID=2851023 RepID=UPI00225E6CDF|nr:Txe/YoeB family addiction module toxin [Anianabacter salinae]MBV0912815.1 Txe/YoeB family addiction module toxin [Anianabacter salinae]